MTLGFLGAFLAAASIAISHPAGPPAHLDALNVAVQTASPSPSPSPAPPQPPKVPKKLRISQGVAEELIVRRVQPKYPAKARQKHLTGDVMLQVGIDRSGNVDSVKVLKGDPILAQAASEAVKQWKFKPFLLNGEPVELETNVKVVFR